jgi:hypothetical protein
MITIGGRVSYHAASNLLISNKPEKDGGYMKSISVPLVRVRALLIFFMFGLVVSGLSAVPLQWEVGILKPLFGSGSQIGGLFPAVSTWIDQVYQGVRNGYGHYPFLAYGTDWLAFGHVAIALAFIGPLRELTRNLWESLGGRIRDDRVPFGHSVDPDLWSLARHPIFLDAGGYVFWRGRDYSALVCAGRHPQARAGTMTKLVKTLDIRHLTSLSAWIIFKGA